MYGHRFPDHNWTNDRLGMLSDTRLNLDKFRCPADDGPPLGHEDGAGPHCPDWITNSNRSSFDHFGNSYAANLFMIGASGGGEMLSNSPYLRPQSRVPHPSRTIYYEENIGRWAWAARRELEDCQWIGQGVDPGVPSENTIQNTCNVLAAFAKRFPADENCAGTDPKVACE